IVGGMKGPVPESSSPGAMGACAAADTANNLPTAPERARMVFMGPPYWRVTMGMLRSSCQTDQVGALAVPLQCLDVKFGNTAPIQVHVVHVGSSKTLSLVCRTDGDVKQ